MDLTPLLSAPTDLKLLLIGAAIVLTMAGIWVGRMPLAALRQKNGQLREDMRLLHERENSLGQQYVLQQKENERLTEVANQFEQLQQDNNRLKSLCTTADAELKHSCEQALELRQQHQHQLELLNQLQEGRLELQTNLQQAQTSLSERQSHFLTQVQQFNERTNELKQQLSDSQSKLEYSQQSVLALTSENQELKTSLDEKQQHFAKQLQLLENSKTQLSQQFEQLANEILERKGQAFSVLNKESMANILSPIHAELKGFKEKVETIHTQETEQRAKLRTELENLQSLNKAINDQADKLTNALQGQKKVQGNWGELMLENVLDKAGLQPGQDYRREQSFNTEEGRLRPDAVVYLPQDKHLVIDAKTSLNAYTRYVNAEDDTERSIALRQHADAVRDRITELANKRYHKLPGLNSPEVVIMFIPIESAYVEALKFDNELFQKALEQHVLVTTPTTLLTSLNVVRQLWRLEDQSKHAAELANRAERFYEKLRTFLESMSTVGKQLDNARTSYDKAMGQLYGGRGNLIKQAAEFKDLGVSVQKELPQEMVEKAQLELGNTPELTAVPSSVNNS